MKTAHTRKNPVDGERNGGGGFRTRLNRVDEAHAGGAVQLESMRGSCRKYDEWLPARAFSPFHTNCAFSKGVSILSPNSARTGG